MHQLIPSIFRRGPLLFSDFSRLVFRAEWVSSWSWSACWFFCMVTCHDYVFNPNSWANFTHAYRPDQPKMKFGPDDIWQKNNGVFLRRLRPFFIPTKPTDFRNCWPPAYSVANRYSFQISSLFFLWSFLFFPSILLSILSPLFLQASEASW